jgi:uncharacterized heparinase superfamily protein
LSRLDVVFANAGVEQFGAVRFRGLARLPKAHATV